MADDFPPGRWGQAGVDVNDRPAQHEDREAYDCRQALSSQPALHSQKDGRRHGRKCPASDSIGDDKRYSPCEVKSAAQRPDKRDSRRDDGHYTHIIHQVSQKQKGQIEAGRRSLLDELPCVSAHTLQGPGGPSSALNDGIPEALRLIVVDSRLGYPADFVSMQRVDRGQLQVLAFAFTARAIWLTLLHRPDTSAFSWWNSAGMAGATGWSIMRCRAYWLTESPVAVAFARIAASSLSVTRILSLFVLFSLLSVVNHLPHIVSLYVPSSLCDTDSCVAGATRSIGR